MTAFLAYMTQRADLSATRIDLRGGPPTVGQSFQAALVIKNTSNTSASHVLLASALALKNHQPDWVEAASQGGESMSDIGAGETREYLLRLNDGRPVEEAELKALFTQSARLYGYVKLEYVDFFGFSRVKRFCISYPNVYPYNPVTAGFGFDGKCEVKS